ncbi:heparinase II/III-family protein [Oceanospirillaceae bacterium]|nr:heparinase II/III-family protein [Oceanospirillaceae bacterium]
MLKTKIKTAIGLGLLNLGRVAYYKFSVKIGLNPVRKLATEIQSGNFFLPYNGSIVKYKQNNQWHEQLLYFDYITQNMDYMPNWHKSCLTGKLAIQPLQEWYSIPDFNDEIGDIKGVWEASRFNWIISFSQRIACGNSEALAEVNEWLFDWVEHNPPYLGVNWKCGQEASIRVMHLAMAAKILYQIHNTSHSLLSLIKAHLKRISPTIMYAVAQDNNHGTSEAAALYIGGSWLVINGDNDGVKWQSQGLQLLENRAKRLIEQDGSFGQYSTTYHRVMLDSYSMVEVWRRDLGLPCFSERTYKKLDAAATWLYTFTQPDSGDAPNLGANDGARLLPLTGTDYRDFRPSVQLACALFHDKAAYCESGEYDNQLAWLNLNKHKEAMPAVQSTDFPDGGYTCLKNQNCFLLFNYPQFKFRPSQCDALHVDFWLHGMNVFRDGGTFSYNAGQKYIDYYGGVKSHNTVQFDNHEQMPRLSRFLLGDWLKLNYKEKLDSKRESESFGAGYRDRFGCYHKRDVSLSKNQLVVVDELSEFKERAVLRWRLTPDVKWRLTDLGLHSELCAIKISCDVRIKRIELVTGYESRYYYQENKIAVLEVEIESSGAITTEVNF